MAFALPELPYAKTAFGEVISAETFDFHHGKHHKAYVDKANELAPAAGLEGASLVEVIKKAKETGNKPLFNNAAQIWNHSFYWLGLSPEGGAPSGKLAELIAASFGDQAGFVDAFQKEAVGHFGSGWTYLLLEGDKLVLKSYHDAETPALEDGAKPLLVLDVWEHAYYIDYRNARPVHVKTLLEKAVNWDFVASNLDGSGVSKADQA